MKGFWTCGPFKESHDKIEKMIFKGEQMKVFMDILEEDKANKILLESDDPTERALAQMVQKDIDKKIAIILGVPYGYEEENDEIFGETILKFLSQRSGE